MALVSPVFFLFVYFGKAEMGLTFSIVLGAAMLAIKLRWELRRHAWFWMTAVLLLALQIPIILTVQWPKADTSI